MDRVPISKAKRARLRALSTPEGVIAALAMDQRKSLRHMIGAASPDTSAEVPDSALVEFKTAVSSVLTGHTSAILLDPEHGLEAAGVRAKGCGLLMAYELDGYENPRPDRMLALMPHLSVRRLRNLGAQGIKILLHYAPDGNASANDEKCALIERIGHECSALDMPFFLEPVIYDEKFDQRSFEFARRKPELVIKTMDEFSRDIYNVDILKVEFPVTAAFVEGSAVNRGPAAYSMDTALVWFRAVDTVARRPYIYLSAGISSAEFLESLRLAVRGAAQFSGVLCGRATWQDGVPVYAQSCKHALYQWLGTTGVRNLHAINELLKSATPWEERYEAGSA